MTNNVKYSIITLVMLFLTLLGYSQPRDTYTTTSGGSWVNALNWDLGVPDNDQTNGSDDIIITHHITLTDDLTVKSGTNITVEGCDTLHVTGNATFNNGSAITVEPCAVLIIDGNLTNNNNSTDIQINGKVIIGGDYDGGTGSELTGTGEMEVEGSVTTDGGATVFGSGEDCVTDCDNSNDDPLGNDPLPIELVFFTVQHIEEGIRLEWLTASETNNDFFEIRRSTDLTDWDVIGTVKGAGNSSSPLMYSFIDNRPGTGYIYYQLIQYDYDGTETTEKMTYTYIQKTEKKDINIWPNPGKSHQDINVELIGFNGEEVLIVVMDVMGAIYYEKAVLTKPHNTIVVMDSKLSPGSYIIVGTNKQELYKKKLIIK
jgi:hypothetical protein